MPCLKQPVLDLSFPAAARGWTVSAVPGPPCFPGKVRVGEGLSPQAFLSLLAMNELHQLSRNHPCCESQAGPECSLWAREDRECSRNQTASQDGTRWTPTATCGSCSGRVVFLRLTLGVISLQLLHIGLVNSLIQAL